MSDEADGSPSRMENDRCVPLLLGEPQPIIRQLLE